MSEFVAVSKDAESQQPIPSPWRETLCGIVEAFRKQDYRLAAGLAGVREISAEAARRIAGNIEAYGAHLVSLPEESWETSVCQWMETYWEVLVDLFTMEEGSSDLVLHARVYEDGEAYAYEVSSVHVP